MSIYERIYLFFTEKGENLNIFGSVLIGAVHPELVEGVRRGLLRVEPDIAFLGLSELTAI